MLKKWIEIYRHPRLWIILLLGFSSGLPLALTASTLGVRLLESGIDRSAIGLFAAVATPYNFKFLWAPLIDSISFPILCAWLGRRRGWMIATQIALMGCIMLLGLVNPQVDPWLTALVALGVALCSASQDIVIDAYRVEILKPEEQGGGAAAIVLGYRFGMMTSMAGALHLASNVSWGTTYFIMASLVAIGMITVLFAPEPELSAAVSPVARRTVSQWFHDAVIEPFADFMTREQWFSILLFILLYKLGDAFMGSMPNIFYLQIGFTKDQIASIVSLYGLIATIIGSFIGGAMVSRLGIVRSLWICGIAHAATNLMFVVQAAVGADAHILVMAITMENITGGMGTAAFVAFMSSLTHVRFTATQYALLSSFSAVGRTWLSTPAGWLSKVLGWEMFFVFAASLAVPGLITLSFLSRRLDMEKKQ